MLFLSLLLLSTAFISCAGGAGSPSGGADAAGASLAIQLPDTSRAVDNRYAKEAIVSFTVTVSSGSFNSTKSANRGEKMLFSNLPAGNYSVKAYGKTSNGAVAAKCETSVTIVAGETTTTTLHLSRLNHWTVKFLDNDGSEISSQDISDGYTATKPADPAPLEGKKFSYWTADATVSDTSAPFSFNTPITGEITLKPVYGAITYTVTYVSAPQAVVSDTYTVATPLTLPTPSKDGYRFDGWYMEEDCSGTKVESLSAGNTGNKTYYAKWYVNIRANAHSDTSSTTPYEVLYGSTVASLPITLFTMTHTKAHATFAGWHKSSYTDDDGSSASSAEYDFSAEVTEPFSLHGLWNTTWITWESPITLDSNYTSETGTYREYNASSSAWTLPEPTAPTGLTFAGWYEDEDFTSAKITSIPSGTTNGAKTFYAKWTATVTFDSNGGSAVTAQPVTYNGKATAPTDPTKTGGLSFVGWYTSDDGGTTLSSAAYDFDTVVTSDITLYADWGLTVSGLSDYLASLPTGSTSSPNVLPEIKGLTTSNWTGIATALKANSTKFVDLSATTLPAGITNMQESFKNCTSLVVAPEIPSTVRYMEKCFNGCTNLTVAPEIPAGVTNINYCFYDCRSLMTAPEIPTGVTIMQSCFYNCRSLTTAPEIPAGVTDMTGCFMYCTSLTTAPVIPDRVSDMEHCFRGCRSLTTAPVIPAIVTDMYSCFSECSNLTTAPVIPASVTTMYCCFDGCDKLSGTIIINSEVVTNWKKTFNSVPSSVTVKVKSDAVKNAIISTATTGDKTYTINCSIELQ